MRSLLSLEAFTFSERVKAFFMLLFNSKNRVACLYYNAIIVNKFSSVIFRTYV